MDGYGSYQWNDGRIYTGQYLDDKKHGYGMYRWADGRMYNGFWYNGKQHGLGTYIVANESREKHGLWEEGKRIEWFDPLQKEQIEKGTLDYKNLFSHQYNETEGYF